jgi:hypothetical protein
MRCKIRVSQKRGGSRRKKNIKSEGYHIIMKRGMQWTRLQIRVLTDPIIVFSFFFFNSCGVILQDK